MEDLSDLVAAFVSSGQKLALTPDHVNNDPMFVSRYLSTIHQNAPPEEWTPTNNGAPVWSVCSRLSLNVSKFNTVLFRKPVL